MTPSPRFLNSWESWQLCLTQRLLSPRGMTKETRVPGRELVEPTLRPSCNANNGRSVFHALPKAHPSIKPQKETEAPTKGLGEQSTPPCHSEFYFVPFSLGASTQLRPLGRNLPSLSLFLVNHSRAQRLQKLKLLQTEMT